MLKQNLSQKLLQKLSPQQIQFIKLLQIPTAALEVRIKEEIEENPALDDGEINEEENNIPEYGDESKDKSSTDTNESNENEISMEEYLGEEEDYKYKDYLPDDPNDDRYERPVIQMSTLYDVLLKQIDMFNLTEIEKSIAIQIIGSIDEDGYLRREIEAITDELIFKYSLSVTDEEVEKVVHVVQELDPAGVCARDLQECLELQLRRKTQTPDVKHATAILVECFEEFTKKHFDKIKEKLHYSDEEFKNAYNLITRLNPKPGESTSESTTQFVIIPDFLLNVNDGKIDIKLNRKNAPELRLNKKYLKILADLQNNEKKEANKEALAFVKNKIESAKWFIDAIKQRQFTLLKTMLCIADKQKEFFLADCDESFLKPMILKDVAEEIEMDISTVSRVANSKYVQTEMDIFPLKFFFSEGIATDSGEEVSNKEVKKMLKEFIDKESKKRPLSDDKLGQMLNKAGYNIARRTIAKYREQLNIPVARLRKEV